MIIKTREAFKKATHTHVHWTALRKTACLKDQKSRLKEGENSPCIERLKPTKNCNAKGAAHVGACTWVGVTNPPVSNKVLRITWIVESEGRAGNYNEHQKSSRSESSMSMFPGACFTAAFSSSSWAVNVRNLIILQDSWIEEPPRHFITAALQVLICVFLNIGLRRVFLKLFRAGQIYSRCNNDSSPISQRRHSRDGKSVTI